MPMELQPEETLLAALVKRAIRDAKADRSERVRYEASTWLWQVSPSVAQRAGVPQTGGTDARQNAHNHTA